MSQRLRPSVPRSGGLGHRAAVPLPIASSWDTMRRCVPPRLDDAAPFWDATVGVSMLRARDQCRKWVQCCAGSMV